MMNTFNHFIFDRYIFDESAQTLRLRYRFDDEVLFEENIHFDFPFTKQIHESNHKQALENAFFGLWVMAGISYFKAALPPKIRFQNQGLTTEQKSFFETVYFHGLGEFFYQNKINPHGKINFIVDPSYKPKKARALPSLSGHIVPIGGGKDSLTSAEILKRNNQNFETWTVGQYSFFPEMLKKIGKKTVSVKRTIAPELLKLNQHGALNGHVPISAILAFLSVCTALLRGRKNIVFSNEHSANEATTHYLGQPINHQYSKTLDFEQAFQAYVCDFISPDVRYFSLLRPFTELKIAKIFSRLGFDRYKDHFSSCNRNFHIQPSSESTTPLWCGKCPKCAFVFAILAPFVDRTSLIELFKKNLFTDPELSETFYELLGKRAAKPFECVGTIKEVQKAFFMAQEKFPEVKAFLNGVPEPHFDWQKRHPHVIPNDFLERLKNF